MEQAKTKILIVEDESNICEVLKEYCEMQEMEVTIALRAETGFQKFKDVRPNACLVDINLSFSEYNGIELIRRIKSIDATVPCFVLTAINDPAIRKEAEEVGVTGYYLKPLSLDALDDLAATVKRQSAS